MLFLGSTGTIPPAWASQSIALQQPLWTSFPTFSSTVPRFPFACCTWYLCCSHLVGWLLLSPSWRSFLSWLPFGHNCQDWITFRCLCCSSSWCELVSWSLANSWSTAWCHPCEGGGWLLPCFIVDFRSQSCQLSGSGGSDPWRTAVAAEHHFRICCTW